MADDKGNLTFTIDVNANSNWQGSKVTLKPGGSYKVSAFGVWVWNPPLQGQGCDPEGNPRFAIGIGDATYPLPGKPGGILVGRVGSNG